MRLSIIPLAIIILWFLQGQIKNPFGFMFAPKPKDLPKEYDV